MKAHAARLRPGCAAALLGCMLAALALAAPGCAAAQSSGHITVAPPPESATEQHTTLGSTFEEPLLQPGRLRSTSDWATGLRDLPTFFGDTNFTLKPRTYYYDQTAQPSGKVEQAWALGGSIEYRSGLAWDRLWVGAEFFGSWPLQAGPNAGETLLLSPQGSSYTVLGQAYAAASLTKTDQLIGGRFSSIDTPYVNAEFNRMTPNAFQGALLNGTLGDGPPSQGLHYLVGYLDKIKERNSTQFVPMSQAAGSTASQGTALGAVRYAQGEWALGVAEYYTADVMNIAYLGASSTPTIAAPYEFRLSGQYTNQHALAGARPLPWQWGLQAVGSRDAAVLTLAFTQTGSAGTLVSPWGNAPSYTRTEIHSNSRAGENAALGLLSYHFDRLGVPGLSAAALAARYWDAVSTPSKPQPNQTEVDLYLDYKIPKGPFDGLWFRLQHAEESSAGGGQTRQWRAIVYWEVPLL